MLSDCYIEIYLQSFYDDLDSLMSHITYKLKNPEAAYKLYKDIFDATKKRTECPTSFETVKIKNRRYPYYRIYVGNFIVYYVVIDRQVEYRRVLYKRMRIREL